MRPLLTLLLIMISCRLGAQTAIKKVLLEEFTGTWCIWCGEGAFMAEEIRQSMPGTAILVAEHLGDELQTGTGQGWASGFEINVIASALIDRNLFPGRQVYELDRTDWKQFVSLRSNTAAVASVSFDNCHIRNDGTTYDFDLNVVFHTTPIAPMPLSVNVLVLEDSIPAVGSLRQRNVSPIVQPGNDPMVNWFHNNTLRQALAGPWGANPFPAKPATGITYKQHFTFIKPSNWSAQQIRLAGFVACNGLVDSNGKEILNSEQVALKTFTKPASVAETPRPEIRALAPNPASGRSIVRLEYRISHAGHTALQMYSCTGQLIAELYSGFDTEGIHTISFRPDDYRLPAGPYFLQLRSNGGSFVHQLVIR